MSIRALSNPSDYAASKHSPDCQHRSGGAECDRSPSGTRPSPGAIRTIGRMGAGGCPISESRSPRHPHEAIDTVGTDDTRRRATICIMACALCLPGVGCASMRLALWPSLGSSLGEDSKTATTVAGEQFEGMTRQVTHEAPDVTSAFDRLTAVQQRVTASKLQGTDEDPVPHGAELAADREAVPGDDATGGWSPAVRISGPGWFPDSNMRR